MILLIDNYDSFTYNLYQYLSELGASVEVRRNDALSVDDVERMAPEAIVVSSGDPADPRTGAFRSPPSSEWGSTRPPWESVSGTSALPLPSAAMLSAHRSFDMERHR